MALRLEPSAMAPRTMRVVRASVAFMMETPGWEAASAVAPAAGDWNGTDLLRDADALVCGGQEAASGVDLGRGEHRRVRQLAAALRAADLLVRRSQEAAGNVAHAGGPDECALNLAVVLREAHFLVCIAQEAGCRVVR